MMNHRERFLATMSYQPRDRSPLYDFGLWDETPGAWRPQGLPDGIDRSNAARFFGLDAGLGGGEPEGWSGVAGVSLCPGFPTAILDDDGDEYTQRQSDGVIVRKQRSSVSIPMHIGHTLVDRESWAEHYLPRLNPDTAARYPSDDDPQWSRWRNPHRDTPLFAHGGSLFGRLRDWMGLENISMVVYDDPGWFESMVSTKADLIVTVLKRMFDRGVHIDAIGMWEDMCYNAGPLLSPAHFKRFLVPHYRRIAELARAHGCNIIWVDCDGCIDALIPLWLDAGINCMFPIEVGTWSADPITMRKRYGRDLLLMGGFDKRILARDPQAIDHEILRLAPLVEEGGFIPMPDHRVPPDVPLANYIHYTQSARKIWGGGVNLESAPVESIIRARQVTPNPIQRTHP
ncbi:MAG: hypothetical protein JJU36_18185 [Phycisphaeraceae bacterium]|nr:hypothetical protein [Phycisphaeraceae bacterium]